MLPGKRCTAGFSRNAASSLPGSMRAIFFASSVPSEMERFGHAPSLVLGRSGYLVGMTQPVRETARGQADDTPVRALTGVTITIGVAFVLLLAICFSLWFALK